MLAKNKLFLIILRDKTKISTLQKFNYYQKNTVYYHRLKHKLFYV